MSVLVGRTKRGITVELPDGIERSEGSNCPPLVLRPLIRTLPKATFMSIPDLKWAQRHEKVFVTFEAHHATRTNVTFADGLLSLDTLVQDKTYKLENMTLWAEIDVLESKWFRNDRSCNCP